MVGKPVKLPFLKLNNSLPYWFEEEDITKVFDACKNIKHLAMLRCLFYVCLRPAAQVGHPKSTLGDVKLLFDDPIR